MSWRKGFLNKHGADKMLHEFDVEFRPETPEEKEEYEKQHICNLLDAPSWNWLKQEISDQRLSWPAIMKLVAAHI